MKTTYSPEFRATLALVGLTPGEWRMLARDRYCPPHGKHRHRRTHWVRQFVKKIQQVHSGKPRWVRGQLCARTKGGDALRHPIVCIADDRTDHMMRAHDAGG